MIRGTIILMALAVLVSGTSQEKAAAQPRKGLPKWEYATLNYMENDAGSFAAWINAKERFTAKSKTKHHESLTKIHKDLGGKEEVGIFDVAILLSRIGQDGWELVTHTKERLTGRGEAGQTYTWTFKRPAVGERETK
jgi:hypothetical protein